MLNKNEVVRSLTTLKKQEYQEMKDLISDYRRSRLQPRQVVCDDTTKGSFKGDVTYTRTEVFRN